MALYVEYNKLVVSEFSLNLKRNLGNDAHLKLGPVFLGHPVHVSLQVTRIGVAGVSYSETLRLANYRLFSKAFRGGTKLSIFPIGLLVIACLALYRRRRDYNTGVRLGTCPCLSSVGIIENLQHLITLVGMYCQVF